ncbi:Pycsar system effector family protein [Pseudorhizobium flavum]|uniref:Pycsar effector protein domain-containing protein n=1 Tax=Pseudorhizobium flavum TaxID=1335061 RepID=A0A7X0DDR1_9HYPH|nr:Pycsar system effector family protein [Pseudorhizobium flavum]MBB6179344.1 hypothetical protein [Pseudorhizobium flavum]CAD6604663.1 hypothetical protein RFYW14_01612 [Pseudorhizobium flavum]
MDEFKAEASELLDDSHVIDDVEKEYFSHVKKINDVFYDQVKISDQKAAYIFTFLLAFLVTSSDGREVFSMGRYLESDVASNLAAALLAVASVTSLLCAVLVVLPRNVPRSTSLFWGTWPQHRPLLVQAVRASDSNYLFNQYLENADILSLIARRKYWFVSLSFKSLVVTLIAYVLVLVVK